MTKFEILYESIMNSLLLENRKDDYLKQLQNKDIENAEEVSDSLFALNNPKKEKCFLWWILKKSVVWPEDSDKMEQAFNVIDKQHLNFQDFERPMEVINRHESRKILAQDSNWSPDKEPAFSNPTNVGNGIVTYDVSDDKAGQVATRKAIDVNWGYDKNPWCLAARKEGILRHNADEISQMSEQQKQQLGLYSDNELETAWKYWNRYNAYPKRIAFKNGDLFAFSANNQLDVVWWDKNNERHEPKELGINDEKFFNEKVLPILIEKSKSKNVKDRIKVANSKNTPIEILKTLVNDKNWNIRRVIAQNENTPVEILEMLANDEDDSVRRNVAFNKNTSIEILKMLAHDKDATVRRDAAWNENTPAEVLKVLANDEDISVRCYVAGNKNTPVEILKMLAKDEDDDVRRNVADNENTPVEILEMLANDDNANIRYSVAWNESAPVEILKMLANDKSEDVRRNIARNKNTPVEVLKALANNEDWKVRCNVAKNKNTPAETLKMLTNDEDNDVRCSVAVNKNTPVEILEKLTKDESSDVRKHAEKNLRER